MERHGGLYLRCGSVMRHLAGHREELSETWSRTRPLEFLKRVDLVVGTSFLKPRMTEPQFTIIRKEPLKRFVFVFAQKVYKDLNSMHVYLVIY